MYLPCPVTPYTIAVHNFILMRCFHADDDFHFIWTECGESGGGRTVNCEQYNMHDCGLQVALLVKGKTDNFRLGRRSSIYSVVFNELSEMIAVFFFCDIVIILQKHTWKPLKPFQIFNYPRLSCNFPITKRKLKRYIYFKILFMGANQWVVQWSIHLNHWRNKKRSTA